MKAVVRELLRIYDRDGKLTQEQVVAEATDPSSPLHTHFEWNDDVAAHRWRLNQASELIRKSEVHLVIDERTFTVRAIPHIEGQGYTPIHVAMRTKPLRTQLMVSLQRDIDRMIARYERYDFAAGIVKDLRAWRERMESDAA